MDYAALKIKLRKIVVKEEEMFLNLVKPKRQPLVDKKKKKRSKNLSLAAVD